MRLLDKGPIQKPPPMPGLLGYVSDEVMSWPGVIAAKHWDLYRPGVPDGADFYIGDSEIGHIHFHGEAHVASNKTLCDSFVKLGKAQPFRYRADPSYQYWTQVKIDAPEQAQNAIDLLRANYQRLRSGRGEYNHRSRNTRHSHSMVAGGLLETS